jgi:hypothetical protein
MRVNSRIEILVEKLTLAQIVKKFCHRKSPVLVPNLSEMNTVRTLPPYLFKIQRNTNLTLSSVLTSPE